MDVRAMEFPPDCFDAIIDKATLDCVFASRDAETDVPRAIQGIYTCLKPGGVYFCVSNAAPDRRFPFLKLASFHWTIDVLELSNLQYLLFNPQGSQRSMFLLKWRRMRFTSFMSVPNLSKVKKLSLIHI
eukprot:TRINITY_DN1701_c0_g1_i12.p1 TRINITY_DN1701_c0_g1~~TRINITY_DN1701_c0_g1_i12.p1  ORF type:complete len:129 (-),score=6.20 TRINITY_DN1701_c0_g1_i12:60-446(-)